MVSPPGKKGIVMGGSSLGGYVRSLRTFSAGVRVCLVVIAVLGFTISGGISSVVFNLYLLRLGYGPEFIGLLGAVSSLATVAFSVPAGLLGRRLGSSTIGAAGDLGALCEIFYYLGAAHLARGRLEAAEHFLEACWLTGQQGFSEHMLARLELSFLGKADEGKEREGEGGG